MTVPVMPTVEFFHPQLYEKITILWGEAECRHFLLTLINDTRGDKRHGFDQAAAVEIMDALVKHDKEYPWYDTTHKVDIPFSGIKKYQKPVYHDDGYEGLKIILGFAFKVISAILVLGLAYKYFR
jgi:hypothetical protein